MNHTDNREEQEDRALFICVCINTACRKQRVNTHTSALRKVCTCRCYSLFPAASTSSFQSIPCQISVSFPARTVGNIVGKAGLQSLSMDNFVHVCALTAVSSLCETAFALCSECLRGEGHALFIFKSLGTRATHGTDRLLRGYWLITRVKLSTFCLPTTYRGEGNAALSPWISSPFRTHQNENGGDNQTEVT